MQFARLNEAEVKGKRVLVRMDLNVPMQGGRITDDTRIVRLLPTLRHLIKQKARVIILSHFDRPNGQFVPSMSLAPLVDAVAIALGKEVRFGVDCIGAAAQEAVAKLQDGEVLLLENLRFHTEEEKGDDRFARELASLGEVYINDAFSCSHRAHASIVGIPKYLPAYAGALMQVELEHLREIFTSPKRPIAAIVGGSKVSGKIELLENLTVTMDKLLIGGAMANTFLYALGHDIGKSIAEKNMASTAKKILARAKKHGCEIVLPTDLIVTEKFAPKAACRVVKIDAIPSHYTATDIGPESATRFAEALRDCKTIIWNGPVGAFETSPFDGSTLSLTRSIASFTEQRMCRSIAGGGDTVAAIAHCGLSNAFSYISTAGGAFLEWLEGKPLPGVVALQQAAQKAKKPAAPKKKAARL